MRSQKITSATLGFLLFCAWALAPAAYANPFSVLSVDKGKKGKVHGAENQDYAVFFMLTGKTQKIEDHAGKEKKMREFSYKFVNRTEDPQKLFAPSGALLLRLQDKEGFSVVEDLVFFDKLFAQREYYGFVWADAKKAKKIVKADVQKVKAEDLSRIKRRKARAEAILSEHIEKDQREKVEKLREPKKNHLGFLKVLNPFSWKKGKKINDSKEKSPEEIEKKQKAWEEELAALRSGPTATTIETAAEPKPVVVAKKAAKSEIESVKSEEVKATDTPSKPVDKTRYTEEDISQALEEFDESFPMITELASEAATADDKEGRANNLDVSHAVEAQEAQPPTSLK